MKKIALRLKWAWVTAKALLKVKEIIQKAVKASQYTLDSHETIIGIEKHDTHFLIIAVRPYINPDDYWLATYDINERIKSAFGDNGVEMPYSEGVEMGKIAS